MSTLEGIQGIESGHSWNQHEIKSSHSGIHSACIPVCGLVHVFLFSVTEDSAQISPVLLIICPMAAHRREIQSRTYSTLRSISKYYIWVKLFSKLWKFDHLIIYLDCFFMQWVSLHFWHREPNTVHNYNAIQTICFGTQDLGCLEWKHGLAFSHSGVTNCPLLSSHYYWN